MLIFMYLSVRPFNDPSLPAVIESSFGFPSMHSSVHHVFVAPTYPLMQLCIHPDIFPGSLFFVFARSIQAFSYPSNYSQLGNASTI